MKKTEEGAKTIAQLMCVSARTAPKAKGDDSILIHILEGNDKEKVAEEMENIAEEKGWKYFIRDANNLRNSSCAVLIGVKNKPVGLHCGGCGHDCDTILANMKNEGDFGGPMCIFKTIDLGIALSSAAKTASIHNTDNRMMYTVGLASKRSGIMDGDVVVGIPISIKGKNIFFDR
ncbi:MAG: ferredoxin domain-containing protein [Candidatus Methanofastidiosia archaeon]